MQTTKHPTDEQLHQFAVGALEDAQMSVIAEHIEACDTCLDIVSDTPNDRLLSQLNSIGTGFALNLPKVEDLPPVLTDHPRYEIIKELGRGGMGAVFLARHRVMNRHVALKLIRPDLTRNTRIVERFMKEVRVSGQHSHPNIVTAFDAEHDESSLFLVMEHVEGMNLHDLVRKNGPLPIRQSCHFALQVAQGLDHAHRRGLIHRDIKPKNLIVTKNGRVKILDFGLATLLEVEGKGETEELTETGVVLGSPDYISPEQASDAKKADCRSDVYSLGCTLFFMLTGRVPFKFDSLAEKIGAHLHVAPPDPQSIRADIPDDLSQITLRMLSKKTADRPQDHNEVIELLRPFAKSTTKSKDSTQVAAIASPPIVPVPQDAPAFDTMSEANAESVVQDPTIQTPVLQTPMIQAAELQSSHAPVSPYVRPTPQKRSKIVRPKWLVPASISTGAVLLILLVAWAMGAFSGGTTNTPNETAKGNNEQNRNNEKTQVIAKTKDQLRVLVVTPFNNYWPPDFEGVVNELERQNINYSVASTRKGNAIASKERPVHRQAVVDHVITGNEGEEVDAIIFIGAYPVEDMVFIKNTAGKAGACQAIHSMIENKKIVAGVCGGVAPIYDADIKANYRLAYSQYMPKRMQNDRSFNWERQEDVIADYQNGATIISGRKDSDARAVTERVIQELKKQIDN